MVDLAGGPRDRNFAHRKAKLGGRRAAPGETLMNMLVKAALAGGGLYLLIRYTGIDIPFVPDFGGDSPSPAPATSPEPAIPGFTQPAAGGGAGDSAVMAQAASGNASAIQESIRRGLKQNADQWNWHHNKATGQTTTTDLFPDGDRGFLMDANEYRQRRQSAGLGGIRLGW